MNKEETPPDPEKKTIIDKDTTRRLREKWLKKGLQIPTQKKQLVEKKLGTPTKRLPIKKLQAPTTRIGKKTTSRLKEKWIKKGLITSTIPKETLTKKESNSNETTSLLSKEEFELLRTDLENKEELILSQFKIDKNIFSKYMQEVYTLLCQNFSTYNEAMEYFDGYIYKEIVNKVTSGDL